MYHDSTKYVSIQACIKKNIKPNPKHPVIFFSFFSFKHIEALYLEIAYRILLRLLFKYVSCRLNNLGLLPVKTFLMFPLKGAFWCVIIVETLLK